MSKKDAKENGGAKPSDEKAQLKKRLESKVIGLLSKPENAGDASGERNETREGGGSKPPAGESGDSGSAAGGKAQGKAKDEEPAAEGPAEEVTDEPASSGGEPDEEENGTAKASGKQAGRGKAEEKKKPQPPREEKPTESLSELMSQKDQVEELLSSIEDSYRDATLPENTYREVKEKNEKKLREIAKKIEALGGAGEAQPAGGLPGAYGTSAGDAAQPAAPRGKAAGAAAAQDAGSGKAEALIKLLEKKIEERLRDVIATASVEVTDKRVRKMEEKLDGLELSVKSKTDTIDSELKILRTAAESVSKYDKQFNSMNTEIEKVKALVDSAKEAKNVMDDKFQRVNENFAEIRSIVYQREAAGKDQSVLLDKLKDTISQIDTARVLREFTTRDEQMRDVNTRLERLERSNKMLTDSMNKIRGLMTDIGSLENVIKASKHVGEKLEKIQEIEERMKASSTKLSGIYVDMKKKLDEFAEYKARQDKLSGTGEDLAKNVEELTRRLSDYATKADISGIRDELRIVGEAAKKQPSFTQPRAAAGAAADISKLREEKGEMETLLETIEENYKSKAISGEDYRKAKENSIRKLADIEKRMKQAAARESAGAQESGDRYSRAMLLAKLRESYETGEITKQAYDRSMKLLLRKK